MVFKALTIRTKRIFRQDYKLDLIYWIMAPTINALIKNASALLVIAIVAAILGLKLDESITQGFGPLRYVIASPRFHRWHHTSEAEGLDKYFAGLFPIFDLMFGTLYMPVSRQPGRFSVLDKDIPYSFWAQMLYPFKNNFIRDNEPQTTFKYLQLAFQ